MGGTVRDINTDKWENMIQEEKFGHTNDIVFYLNQGDWDLYALFDGLIVRQRVCIV